MTDRDYLHTFDWYWSDASSSESSRAQALKERPAETKALAQVSEGNSLVHFALWNALPQGHPVSELWLETETDLQATIYLAYGGYFRQAFVVLRTWFELTVTGVYFANHYKQANSRYWQWRAGNRQAPASMSKIAESLAGRMPSSSQVTCDAIEHRLEPVYSALSHHVHGQGLDLYDLQNGRDNVPRFLGQSFDSWWSAAMRVFNAICYLYQLFYVPEIHSQLAASESDSEHASLLARELKVQAPEFATLISASVRSFG